MGTSINKQGTEFLDKITDKMTVDNDGEGFGLPSLKFEPSPKITDKLDKE